MNAQSVPWFLPEASSGTGEFKAGKFIQRRDTHGGVAPSTSCKGKAELRVPYLFYGALIVTLAHRVKVAHTGEVRERRILEPPLNCEG
ncbi:hypothetical protein [Edaphobacter modestus]|uniref:hypothetical protein n=1 Tax=Edaphobacter modestus TaxID=388466 RepID=UPI003BF87DD8